MFTDNQNATFDEMVDFYFDNPYSHERPNDWDQYIQFDYDFPHNIRFFIELFENASILLQKFDEVTINKGI